MRLSILPDDPGYSLKALDARVYLNDLKIDHAQTVDEERGEILALKMREGKFVLSPVGFRIETEILRGKVRIEF